MPGPTDRLSHDRNLALILRQFSMLTGIPADSVVPDSLMRYVVAADIPPRDSLPVAFGDVTPRWLSEAVQAYDSQRDFIFTMMMEDPANVEYAYWNLPVPPHTTRRGRQLQGTFQQSTSRRKR